MISAKHLAQHLSAAITAGAWSRDGIEAAIASVLGKRATKMPARLAGEIREGFPGPYCPPPKELTGLIGFVLRFSPYRYRMGRQRPFPAVLDASGFAPLPPFRDLDIPVLTGIGDLCAWLDIAPAKLAWFADTDGRNARAGQERFRHYTCHWLAKRSGGHRLIEAPKPRLKQLQRRILHGILDAVPPHPAAFGFVRGRDCLQAAQKHAGEAVVAAFDLAEFFTSVPAFRVHALFRSLGYPWTVARTLTGLCTVTTSADLLAALPAAERHRGLPGRALAGPHLPQGAPTSPALANLAARRLDVRLAGLARRMDAAYTRYADDITFSGGRGVGFGRGRPLAEMVGEIVAEEGFCLNPAKTRVRRSGNRQTVTGIVVNRHLNIRRADYDILKATLHNCCRRGPASQNRGGHPAFRAHLDGRVTWVERLNPRRGARLRAIFDGIDWGRQD